MLNSGLYTTSIGGAQLMPNARNDDVSTAIPANISQKLGRCKLRIVLTSIVHDFGQGTLLGMFREPPPGKLTSSGPSDRRVSLHLAPPQLVSA